MLYKIIKHVLEEEGYKTWFPFPSLKDVRVAHLYVYTDRCCPYKWVCAIRFYAIANDPVIHIKVIRSASEAWEVNLRDPDGLSKMIKRVQDLEAKWSGRADFSQVS